MRAIDLGMVFDMKAYTAQTIDLYKECAKVSSVKPALTPFVADGSLNPDEDEVTGTLAPVACKVLMKALWLARLARPDILKPIGDLASNVQKWSRNHDRQLLRLIQYLVGTSLLLEGTIVFQRITNHKCMSPRLHSLLVVLSVHTMPTARGESTIYVPRSQSYV